uniref:PDZ domain-containing protein n=1 Tax=Seriola dumerili TaxID=41447 RepID=A0A3B4TS75_SERDU
MSSGDNIQEVTLTKNANGLGFSFLMCELDPPTRDFGSLVRIKQLFPGQPAQQSGRIQEGDVLLAVNGQSKDLTAFYFKIFTVSGRPVLLHPDQIKVSIQIKQHSSNGTWFTEDFCVSLMKIGKSVTLALGVFSYIKTVSMNE